MITHTFWIEKAGVLATVSTAAEYTPISMANTPAKELPLAAHVNLKSGHNDRRKSWFSLLSGKNGYSGKSYLPVNYTNQAVSN